MSRLFRRSAIVVLSLALPMGAGAQQGAGEPPATRRAATEAAERSMALRPMEARRPQGRPADAQAAADPRRSLSEAVRRVQRRTGGQILGAEVVPYEGRNISRIKYMDDRGRVRYMDDPGPGERLRHVPAVPRQDDNDGP